MMTKTGADEATRNELMKATERQMTRRAGHTLVPGTRENDEETRSEVNRTHASAGDDVDDES